MVLILLSLIMGFIGLNIGGIIGGAEIYAFLFGLVGVLSPGLYTLERVYKGSKLNKDDGKLFTTEDELGLRDMEVLSNSQLEEVIEMYKKKADKNKNHELYQKYKKLLDELKQDGYLDEGEYYTSLDKLEEHYKVY